MESVISVVDALTGAFEFITAAVPTWVLVVAGLVALFGGSIVSVLFSRGSSSSRKDRSDNAQAHDAGQNGFLILVAAASPRIAAWMLLFRILGSLILGLTGLIGAGVLGFDRAKEKILTR